ncbi:MAG TPA: FHA domain-containing protein [Candidatus Limnocylindria bacterium]|nr:FHA domain-containing protein [Candidatus Limnocylindria bacterium]
MIQFQILSGEQAGNDIVVRRFPFSIGRGAESDLPLAEPGVWDRHLRIDFQRGDGFMFVAHSEALTLINGQKVESGMLRNGDLVELGSAQLRFWLAPAQQRTLQVREIATWTALVALFAGQVGLIYWLLR